MARRRYVPEGTPGGPSSYDSPKNPYTKILKGNKFPQSSPKPPKGFNPLRPRPSGGAGVGGRGNERYGAMGGYPGVRYGDALAMANSEIKPQIHSLQQDRQNLRVESKAARERAQTLYGRSIGDLSHIFDESGDFIDFQNQGIDQAYDQSKDRAAAAQSLLLEHLNANNAAGVSGANAELSRLGIQGSGGMDQFAADNTNALAVATQTGANEQANLSLQQQGADSIGQLLAGMNAGSMASNMGQAVNTRNDMQFEIEQNRMEGADEIRNAIQDLRGERGDLTRTLLQQLQQSGWAQYMDMANLNLQQQALKNSRRGGSRGGSGGRRSSYSTPSGSSSGSGGSSGGSKPSSNKPGGKPKGSSDQQFSDMVMNNFNSPRMAPRKRKK